MLHQASEAAVPILIGVVIDRAVLPRDPGALALWLGVLGAVFLILSFSYQWASLAMVRIYGHGEHDLRQLAVARVLHPRGIRTRRTGEVLSASRATRIGLPASRGASPNRPPPSRRCSPR